MVEYGPFIEYCCELYIHHYVLNIVIAAVFAFSVLFVLMTQAIIFFLSRYIKSWFTEATTNSASASPAPSGVSCASVTCNDQEEKNTSSIS